MSKKTYIKQIADNRYRVQLGKVVVTFEVSPEGKMTLYDGLKSSEAKAYRFVDSDPALIRQVATAIKDAAKFVQSLNDPPKTGEQDNA